MALSGKINNVAERVHTAQDEIFLNVIFHALYVVKSRKRKIISSSIPYDIPEISSNITSNFLRAYYHRQSPGSPTSSVSKARVKAEAT